MCKEGRGPLGGAGDMKDQTREDEDTVCSGAGKEGGNQAQGNTGSSYIESSILVCERPDALPTGGALDPILSTHQGLSPINPSRSTCSASSTVHWGLQGKTAPAGALSGGA